eukprot:jgi/Mesvir1/2113/Mv25639-RA.1
MAGRRSMRTARGSSPAWETRWSGASASPPWGAAAASRGPTYTGKSVTPVGSRWIRPFSAMTCINMAGTSGEAVERMQVTGRSFGIGPWDRNKVLGCNSIGLGAAAACWRSLTKSSLLPFAGACLLLFASLCLVSNGSWAFLYITYANFLHVEAPSWLGPPAAVWPLLFYESVGGQLGSPSCDFISLAWE